MHRNYQLPTYPIVGTAPSAGLEERLFKMLARIKRQVGARSFDRAIADVLNFPPLILEPAPLAIVSMVVPRDLPSYLLALRVLYRRLGRGKVVAIVDQRDMSTLARSLEAHVKGIEIVETESIPRGPCQRGGTWERILYVVDRAQSDYVIQMDSDTLSTSDNLGEVLDCIRDGYSFTLGGGPAGSGQAVVSLKQAAESIDFDEKHICIATQRQLVRFPNAEKYRYVRGSSAFIGLAKGASSRELVEKFHVEMERILGDRWREWGTEQCASNFAVANADGAMALPFPDYCNHDGNENWRRARFIHFYGTYRYQRGIYETLARKALDSLQRKQAAA